jgi:hypothetical protein
MKTLVKLADQSIIHEITYESDLSPQYMLDEHNGVYRTTILFFNGQLSNDVCNLIDSILTKLIQQRIDLGDNSCTGFINSIILSNDNNTIIMYAVLVTFTKNKFGIFIDLESAITDVQWKDKGFIKNDRSKR